MTQIKEQKHDNVMTGIWGDEKDGYITIIGVGDFGKTVLDKLFKYQKQYPGVNFCSNFIYVSESREKEQFSWDSISIETVSSTEIVLIISDLKNPTTLEVCKNLVDRFSEKIVVCFLKGADNNLEIKDITAIVQMNEDVEEAYLALRLFPDLITRYTLIGVDYDDLKQALESGKKFKVTQLNFTKNELENQQVLKKNFSIGAKSIFIVYGDDQLRMFWVDRIAQIVIENSKNGYSGDFLFTAVITAGKSDHLQTVILSAE